MVTTAEITRMKWQHKYYIIKEKKQVYRTDHDRLFKELLQTFFSEFIALFFPTLHQAIDFSKVTFLSQEVFTDIVSGDKRRIDILAETLFKGDPAAILIHVEPQAQSQKLFNERMFIYFSRLYEKYRKRIIPIAVFSHDGAEQEPNTFHLGVPQQTFMQFEFLTVQLKHKNWREYIRHNNPVAAALLSKMGFDTHERVQVKKEFLRMLVRMELTEAKQELLIRFFETYVKLTSEEENTLVKEIEKLDLHESEAIYKTEISWKRQGRVEGKIEIARKMRNKGMPLNLISELTGLSLEEIKTIK